MPMSLDFKNMLSFNHPPFECERMLGEIMSNGSACWERNILNFLKKVQQLQLCFGIKSIVSLGVHESKIRRKVYSLQFLEVKAIKKGGDFFRVRLFLCRDIQRTLKATL
jgi:hypothetical protein